MGIIYNDFDDMFVDGKKVSDWYIDEGDDIKDELEPFKSALKNPEGNPIGIFDLGGFVVDTEVRGSFYENGVDLARLSGSFYRGEPYDEQMSITCLDGWDVLNMAMNRVKNYSTKDLVFHYTKMINGTVFIGKRTKHVFVKGEWGTEEERKAYVDDYNYRLTGKTAEEIEAEEKEKKLAEEKAKAEKLEKEKKNALNSESTDSENKGTTTMTMAEFKSMFKRKPAGLNE